MMISDTERHLNLLERSMHDFEELRKIVTEKLADYPNKQKMLQRLIGGWVEDVREQQKNYEFENNIVVIKLKSIPKEEGVELWKMLDADMSIAEQKTKFRSG